MCNLAPHFCELVETTAYYVLGTLKLLLLVGEILFIAFIGLFVIMICVGVVLWTIVLFCEGASWLTQKVTNWKNNYGQKIN